MTKYFINQQELVVLYRNGSYDELSEQLLVILDSIVDGGYAEWSPELSVYVSEFARVFLYLFTKADYVISERLESRFVAHCVQIGNLVSLTPIESTDNHLEQLRKHDGPLVKILTLLSPRNRFEFETSRFFDENANLASVWYSAYFGGRCITPQGYHNLNRHQESIDPRWLVSDGPQPGGASCPFFLSTYVNPHTDRYVRQHINQCIRRHVGHIPVMCAPNRKRIAIVSGGWGEHSVVYRFSGRFVESLRNDYELTLVQLIKRHDDFDRSLFSDIRTITAESLAAIQTNDFMLAYFTDIGMWDIDRHVANLRFAPIQVTGYGHPTSTWGGEIDYFIGGQDVEDITCAPGHYSERLVLIPGMGAMPCRPAYRPKGNRRYDDSIIINCPWTTPKCNFPHLLVLREIISRSRKKIRFRFISGDRQAITYQSDLRDMQDVLGTEYVEVFPLLAYDKYMELMEEGDFAIDAWPFAGYTNNIDSLCLGKPWVSLEGDMFINRASSALLRQVGLDELIAHSNGEYVERVLRLIHDDEWRRSLHERIRSTDLERTLFEAGHENYFKKALDYLIDNHERLQADSSREPIIIE